jgi:predicted nucleic acid-binding protein
VPYLLDTNCYFIFFQHPRPASYTSLANKLATASGISFYVSEITSMEIHSVLGKYRRGNPRQHQPCARKIVVESRAAQCPNTWTSVEVKRMTPKVFRDIRKLISDIERQAGDIRATILGLDSSAILAARRLLMERADRYRFGSHDALIAGTAISARDKGMNLVVTSDRSLKAVLKKESVPFYDPLEPTTP